MTGSGGKSSARPPAGAKAKQAENWACTSCYPNYYEFYPESLNLTYPFSFHGDSWASLNSMQGSRNPDGDHKLPLSEGETKGPSQ